MKYNFYMGRNNLSVTIFIPIDCTNSCSFCTSKKDYATLKCNIENVLKSISVINQIAVNEVVITGGEPLSNLAILDKIINAIDHSKKIFINTTFCGTPERVVDYINNNDRISGINISRHFSTFDDDTKLFNDIIPDKYIDKLNKPVKINCILSDKLNLEAVIRRWSTHNVILTFREDYRYLNQGNLKTISNEVTNALLQIAGITYLSHGGCDVCFDVTFKYKDSLVVSYHRGLEKSSIILGNNIFVNDIIIKQDGSLMYDWDGTAEHIDEMLLQFSKLLY